MAKSEIWWVIKRRGEIITGTIAALRKHTWVEFWDRCYNEYSQLNRRQTLFIFTEQKKKQGYRAVKIEVREVE